MTACRMISTRDAHGKSTRPAPDAPNESRLARFVAARGRRRRAAENSLIFLEQEPVESIYQVVSGVVRCFVMSEDGRRQITRFAWPGDFLGCVAIDAWHFSAEAVNEVVLRSVPQNALEAALLEDVELQRDMRRATALEMKRRQTHLARVAYMPADDRLYDFLVELSRYAGRRDGYLMLPLMRRDIADHLGLSVETVSRAFTALKRSGRLEMRRADGFRMPVASSPKPALYHAA